MRCSRKSTAWRGDAARVLALVVVLAGCAASDAAWAQEPASHADVVRVETAIVRAVRARMGADAHVTIAGLRVRGHLASSRAVIAVLDPRTVIGRPVRVALKGLHGRGRAVRVGEAECTIHVRQHAFEAVGPVSRGETIGETAVRRVEVSLEGLGLVPVAASPVGARASRSLAPGDVVLRHDVAIPPAVRSGEPVRVRLADGAVAIEIQGVAAQDGHVGEEIRVVNPSSGRMLRGRVVGPRDVEVGHGS
jgi:flagella basal body P-ring formation protein FlgA